MLFRGPIEKFEINDTNLYLNQHIQLVQEKNLSAFNYKNINIIDSS